MERDTGSREDSSEGRAKGKIHDDGEMIGADVRTDGTRMDHDVRGVKNVVEWEPEQGEGGRPGGPDGAAAGGIQ